MSSEAKQKSAGGMNRGTRILLRVVIVIVAIALLMAAAVLILDRFGRGHMTDDGSGMRTIDTAELDNAGRVRYKGQLYKYNKDITTVLLIGVDSRNKENNAGTFGASNQSDVDVLAVFDPHTKQITLINVSRDAMVNLEVLDDTGKSVGTARAQLALAYAYGEGADVSCDLTRHAVSDLFYDLPIHAYASIYIDGVSDLVGEMGSVTVTSLDTFGEFTKGQSVTLTSSNTEAYLRYRSYDLEGNNMRMEREKQVLTALAKAMLGRVRQKPISAVNVYNAIRRNVTTDLKTSSILYIARTAAGMRLNNDVVKLQGESVLGAEDHAEYVVDETALYELILSVFYTPVNG